jgi:hypothetical protein
LRAESRCYDTGYMSPHAQFLPEGRFADLVLTMIPAGSKDAV